MYRYVYIYIYRCRNLINFSYCIFILIYFIYVYNLCSDEPDTNCCRGCASENQTEKTQLRGSGVRGWLGGWVGGWMGGWVVGWVRVFLISRSVRSRMFPAWPRMLPSCAPQVPPMSLVCRPQVLRMFQHVPCERFACSLLHPHVLPYVPACSRVFPACSPHDLCILHACSPHVPCMFPACARMFPACARVFPTCSQHVPRIFPPCSLHVPFLFFEPRQVFG